MNLRALACVSIRVTSSIEEPNTHSERLRADYRVAFRDWALQVGRLRALTTSADECFVVKEAEGRVEAAEVVYRDSRNRLTDDMNQPGE
jgi:hypothetical protein